jgi:hypothetical protein
MYTKQPETYSRRSAARPGRQRYIGHLVLAGIGFAFLAATGLNMLLAGAGVSHDSSEPPGLKSVLLSFLWLAGAAVCLAVAVDAEHRLRGRGLPRGRVSYGPDSARQSVPIARGRRHGRRSSPVTTLITGVVFAVFAGVAVFGAVAAYSDAARSSYTQSNGVADNATVVNVDNSQDTSCARSSCSTSYSAQVTTTLSHQHPEQRQLHRRPGRPRPRRPAGSGVRRTARPAGRHGGHRRPDRAGRAVLPGRRRALHPVGDTHAPAP